MNAKKCDVCGKFYIENKDSDREYALKIYNVKKLNVHTDVDLCDDCYNEIFNPKTPEEVCHHNYVMDTSMVLTSLPPKYHCTCNKCGKTDLLTLNTINNMKNNNEATFIERMEMPCLKK